MLCHRQHQAVTGTQDGCYSKLVAGVALTIDLTADSKSSQHMMVVNIVYTCGTALCSTACVTSMQIYYKLCDSCRLPQH